MEREMQDPSKRFVESLKKYKVLDDWPMPAGAWERLAPIFLGETVYKGGNTAKKWWSSFMAEHGLMECPAAKEVLYYENVEGGHGGAADNKQRAYMSTLAYTFLQRSLG